MGSGKKVKSTSKKRGDIRGYPGGYPPYIYWILPYPLRNTTYPTSGYPPYLLTDTHLPTLYLRRFTQFLIIRYDVFSNAGDSFSIRTNSTDATHNYAYLQMRVDAKRRPDVSGKVAGGGAECGQFILPIVRLRSLQVDADRKMDYDIAPGFYSMQVHVVGWYI